jgi:hypothetical protein
MALTKILKDMEIGTRIYLQWCHLKDAVKIVIGEERTNVLLQQVIEVMKKLESVKYHRDNLLRIIKEELEKRQVKQEGSNCYHIDLTTGVEKELEAFLLQGKSCLDILVKVLNPILGIKLHSYGDSGQKVIKALSRNLSKQEVERAHPLISLIEDDKEWISKWFKAHRDIIAHYRSVISTGFVTKPRTAITGPEHFPPVLEGGMPCHEFVCVLYHNLLTFCEDFIPLAMSIKFPEAFVLHMIPEDQRDKQYPTKFGIHLINKTE